MVIYQINYLGNNNICFAGVDGGKLVLELDKKGICASSGSA